MHRNLFISLSKKIIDSVNNDYNDNFDYTRYDEIKHQQTKKTLKGELKKSLGKVGFYKNQFWINNYFNKLEDNYEEYFLYEYLFDNLELNSSKDLLVKIVAFRLMGHTKVKLPLNDSKFGETYEHLKKLRSSYHDTPSVNSALKLYKHDIETLGFPLKLILSTYGIMVDFVHEQYRFEELGVEIKAEKGDYIIDGGGCYGDTALYFSYLTGPAGKVYSFEFVPSNLDIFLENLSLNPELSTNVYIEKKPLSGKSDNTIYYNDLGPSSTISEIESDSFDSKVETISIDNFVERNKVQKIDFIKLDIEGSEFAALNGGIQSIRKFKPKLAVALYHSPLDFDRIPRLIRELDLGYKFYLKHATINHEETMLFACI